MKSFKEFLNEADHSFKEGDVVQDKHGIKWKVKLVNGNMITATNGGKYDADVLTKHHSHFSKINESDETINKKELINHHKTMQIHHEEERDKYRKDNAGFRHQTEINFHSRVANYHKDAIKALKPNPPASIKSVGGYSHFKHLLLKAYDGHSEYTNKHTLNEASFDNHKYYQDHWNTGPAFQEGITAKRSGKKISDSPYKDKDYLKHEAWIQGHKSA